MAQYVTKIKTTQGDLPIDYNALANKPDVVSKSGDTMTGNLTISTSSKSPALELQAPNNSEGKQANSRIYKNASATADYGLQLRDYAHGGNDTNTSCMLMICNAKGALTDKLQFVNQVNNASTYYKLYGEHNKPTLEDLGVTATASELNKLDGVTATTTELNYVDGVTSNIQTQLNGKVNKSGDTMTGHLTVFTSAASLTLHTPDNDSGEEIFARISKNANAEVDYGLQLRDYNYGGRDAGNSVLVMISDARPLAEKIQLVHQTNNTNKYYKLYGEHNKPTLSDIGVTASAAELNKLDGVTATTAELNILDGITATTAELNYVDGVTSNIQTQLNGKAATSHGTHVTFATAAPKAAGTAAAGTATTVSRSDHVHPAQTTVSGNAGSATKLATARTIRTNLGSTSTANFDGTENVAPGVTGTLPIANGGTGATSAVNARKALGIYVYTGYISTSSAVAAHGLIDDRISAKTAFGLSSVPSNLAIVSATSRSTYFSCNIAHETGSDGIDIKMRNVSGASVGATNYYYTIVGMLI